MSEQKLKTWFFRAILLTAVVCLGVMVKFRSPQKPFKKAHSAKPPVTAAISTPSVAEPTIRLLPEIGEVPAVKVFELATNNDPLAPITKNEVIEKKPAAKKVQKKSIIITKEKAPSPKPITKAVTKSIPKKKVPFRKVSLDALLIEPEVSPVIPSLEEVIVAGLEESPLIDNDSTEVLVAELSSTEIHPVPPKETPVVWQESILVTTDYSPLEKEIESQKKELGSLSIAKLPNEIARPEPELVTPTPKPVASVVAKKKVVPPAQPAVARVEVPQVEKIEVAVTEPVKSTPSQQPKETVQEDLSSDEEPEEEEEPSETLAQNQAPILVAQLDTQSQAPVEASAGTSELGSLSSGVASAVSGVRKYFTSPAPIKGTAGGFQPSSGINETTAEKAPVPEPAPTPVPDVPKDEAKNKGRTQAKKFFYDSPNADRVANEITATKGGTVYGKLSFDRGVDEWFAQNKGHIEMFLHRQGSSNPEDTVFVDYTFPELRFEFEATDLQGKYILYAAFYRHDHPQAVAQISYPTLITKENYRENLIFHLTRKDLDADLRKSKSIAKKSVDLLLSTFEGAAGDETQPKPIAGALVKVLGHPELGVSQTDKDGNLRVSGLNRQSEYVLEISQAAYYSTRKEVTVGNGDVYVTAHLISKEKVDTITKFFTKREQGPGKAVVMGRVYESKTRSPRSGVEVSLSGRRGRPVYFGALPDLNLRRTSSTGLFGFFNVEPSFRSLERGEGTAPQLMDVRADYGYYYEFGRGGEKSLQVKYTDPFSKLQLETQTFIVGSSLKPLESDPHGQLEIPGLDLGPGVLTLESHVEGFPSTWHTISWNAREPEKQKTLYMVPEEVVEGIRQQSAKVQKMSGRGVVFGGAENQFFDQSTPCVKVSLEDEEGHRVATEQGPFPVSKDAASNDLCLRADSPGFAYFNILPGQYILKWSKPNGQVLRSHIVRVGADRLSVVIN